MRKEALFLNILFAGVCLSNAVRGAEFRDEIERDFPIKTMGRLQVSNLRGPISIKGWVLDRVRVKATRVVSADTQEEAKKLFPAADFRFHSVEGDIELSAEYGRDLDIRGRLAERTNPRTRMEMTVFAPATLKLRVLGIDGPVSVKSWNAPLEIRTAKGLIQLSNTKSQNSLLSCTDCRMSVQDLKGSLRCMGGTGEINIDTVQGEQIFVETTTGNQNISNIKAGEHLYVSSAGQINGKTLNGRIEFSNQTGKVDILASEGFASGRTEDGDIFVEMKKWKFDDKAIIESQKGSIQLSVPLDFAAEIELSSKKGQVQTDFVLLQSKHSPNQIVGEVKQSREQLRLISRDGDVRLLKNRVIR